MKWGEAEIAIIKIADLPKTKFEKFFSFVTNVNCNIIFLCNLMILMMSGFVMFDIIFIFTGILLLSHQHDNGSFIDLLEKTSTLMYPQVCGSNL